MAIIGGLDVHRAQITYDYLDTATGGVRRGRIQPALREDVRTWLQRFDDEEDVAFALEGTTGWLYVVEELHRAGIRAHLAEPADTAALRGPKRRAKTDAADAKLLRELLAAGRLPESWIPPAHVEQIRTLVRLRKALLDERGAWHQRLQAKLFHHGLPRLGPLSLEDRRAWFGTIELPPASRHVVQVALSSIERISAEMAPIDAQLKWIARHQPGCRALERGIYGVGWLTAVAIWAELGDVRRFGSSRRAVRHTGLDVTVHSSDSKRSPGHLSRQGPEVLRWALYEAAMSATRPGSPDHSYYVDVKAREGSGRALLSQARRVVRRAHHILLGLGEEALAPAPVSPLAEAA
ncbi:MAG: IS110 family transposase [Actinobacteria bacterium]|nr:IS110 family transposase [Actinomycetota bacterium]